MKNTLSERRLAENEVFFRQFNEGVQRQLEDLRRIAKEHGDESSLPDTDMPLHFYCECADAGCQQRLRLKPSTYAAIHKNRKRFIIVCGHQATDIERIVSQKPGYCIVEKFKLPPSKATRLHTV